MVLRDSKRRPRRFPTYAAAAVIFTVCSAVCAAEILDGSERLVFADALLSRGIYDKAVVEYRAYLKSAAYLDGETAKPGMDRVYYNLGMALYKSGDNTNAAEAFRKVLTEFGDSGLLEESMLSLASCLADSDPAGAEEQYTKVIAVSKDRLILPEALYGRAVVRSASGKTADAVADLETLLSDYPAHRLAPYARVSLGGIFSVNAGFHDYAKAEAMLSEGLKADIPPDLAAEAKYFLGCAYYGQGKSREAASAFREFYSATPGSRYAKAARLRLAWSYFASGMYIEAKDIANAVLSEGAGKSAGEFLYIAACSFFELKQYQNALACYRKSAEVDPNGKFAARSRYQAARSLYNLRNFTECILELKPIMDDPDLRYDALWLCADAARVVKDLAVANQNYGLLVKEFPDSPRADDAFFRMGYTLREASRWYDAASVFMDLYAKFPKSELAPKAVFLAAAAYDSADDERALGTYRLFLEKFPGDADVPSALFRCAMVEIRRDFPDDALRTLDKLIAFYPEWDKISDAHLWRATILSEKGDYNGAETAFRTSLKINPSTETRRIARFSLSLALLKQGRNDEAVKIMLEIVNDPMLANFSHEQLRWLAENLYKRGEYDKSETVALQLLKSAEDSAWKQTALDQAGHAALALGHTEAARGYFTDAAALDARTRYGIDAYYSLGTVYYDEGKYADAEANFTKALNRIGDSPDFGDLRLQAYARLACLSALSGDIEECARRAYMIMVLFDANDESVGNAVETIVGLLESKGHNDTVSDIKGQLARLRGLAGGEAVK